MGWSAILSARAVEPGEDGGETQRVGRQDLDGAPRRLPDKVDAFDLGSPGEAIGNIRS